MEDAEVVPAAGAGAAGLTRAMPLPCNAREGPLLIFSSSQKPTPSPEGLPLRQAGGGAKRSEEHTSELQSLMRISYAVFCLKKQRYEGVKEQVMCTKSSETNVRTK